MTPAPLTDLIVCAAWGLAATAVAVAFVWFLIPPEWLMFGPRDWVVVEIAGVAFAIHRSRLTAARVVVSDHLREAQAKRLARRLRQQAEDRPEPLL